jgi:hypothetical protein
MYRLRHDGDKSHRGTAKNNVFTRIDSCGARDGCECNVDVATATDDEIGKCTENVNVRIITTVDDECAISDVCGVNENDFLFFTVETDYENN